MGNLGVEGSILLTLILLTWTIWRAPTNASKWRMGFNSAFKGLQSIVNSRFEDACWIHRALILIDQSAFDLRKEREIFLSLDCVWYLSSLLTSGYCKLFPWMWSDGDVKLLLMFRRCIMSPSSGGKKWVVWIKIFVYVAKDVQLLELRVNHWEQTDDNFPPTGFLLYLQDGDSKLLRNVSTALLPKSRINLSLRTCDCLASPN